MDDPTNEEVPQGRPRYTEAQLVQIVRNMAGLDANLTARNNMLDLRDQAQDFYFGKRPYALDGNSSDYVSMEVLDSVESLKAKLLRTFRSNREVVRFKPEGEKDVENAILRTKYVNSIINTGGDPETRGRAYKLLHDVFHDGLVSRLACIKFDYVEKEIFYVEEFHEVPIEQIKAIEQKPEVVEIVIEDQTTVQREQQTQMGPVPMSVQVASGYVRIKRNKRNISVDVIPPENVFLPRACINLMDLQELTLRYYKTKYQLIAEGFDPAIIEKLAPESSPMMEQLRRDGSAIGYGDAPTLTGERALLAVYVGYVNLDLETPAGKPPTKTQLYRIVVVNQKLLDIEPTNAINAHFWSPIMQSHRAVGLSLADVTMDIQTSTSNTVRGMEDNVHRVNAGIRIADMELIRNPRDLIDNPIGGIINSPNLNAVNVIPQPQISAATGGLLEVLSLQKEMRTGDTRLGKGLNTNDVVTHQNSGSMIDALINVGNERPLQMARAFAEMCWLPLMQDIYRMGHEHKLVITLEMDGQPRSFDPSSIPFAADMEIDVALTPDYGQQRAGQLMQMGVAIMQNPAVGPLYTMEEQYALYSEVFHLQGTANWLADPKDPVVQQRIQTMMQQSQQMQQMQQALMAKEVELKEREIATKEKAVGIKFETSQADQNLRAVIAAHAQFLKERQFAWQQQVNVAELEIERTQKRPAAIGDQR